MFPWYHLEKKIREWMEGRWRRDPLLGQGAVERSAEVKLQAECTFLDLGYDIIPWYRLG